MRNKVIVVFICVFAILGYHCSRNENTVTQIQNGVVVHLADNDIKIQFYSPSIVRIVKWPSNGTDKKKSLSVVMKHLPDIQVKFKQTSKYALLSTSKLDVRVGLKDGKIEYLTSKGQTILKEGKDEFFPITYKTDTAFTIKQVFELTPDEGVYGLGQHQYGWVNYRRKVVKLVQANTEAVNPFLVSTMGYGILWDNYSKTVFEDDGKKNASFWSDVADNIDYYFIYGENMDQAIAGYRELTGQAPMYGKWAYGYWQSREHYENREELMEVAREYRERKIPIDNIIQDWDYWNGRENWGGMFFDKTLFPRPDEMVNQLHKMNYHMMISIWPALGPNTKVYKDMLRNGYLYPSVGWAGFKYYDAYHPDANEMYWEYLQKGLASKGIDAWWMDSTEPDVINALTKESTEYELKRMADNYLGSFARYLNPYSLVMTENVYTRWRKEYPERRCYILTRSTFSGQQRNAATTWSGDIGASWEIYRRQIAAGINHSMSGIPYWTFDIGGFVLGAYEGVFCNGGKDPAYQELYARMFQFGTFCPIFRSHGSETPREVWEMGKFTEPILAFDHLRYRLLPYIYSLAWQVTDNGYTIMRGLPMDFTTDKNTYTIGDQFMFGPSLMVCPVTEYMYQRPPEKSILISPEYFTTNEGRTGLLAKYCKDNKHRVVSKEQIESNIDIFWYTGRPDYVTDSMFSIRWEGQLIPKETGKYQFHMKSFDPKRIFLDGKQLPIVYTSVEQYTGIVELIAGKEYSFVLETENSSAGATRMQLFWKTPALFAKEQTVEERAKTRPVYLPQSKGWFDFWTGEKSAGGRTDTSDAPIEKIPLFVKAGSIIPMGPFVQYATEKPADTLELRIYPGADGNFLLYEDENDNYNYEKGIFATIAFGWDDAARTLTIGKQKGSFPGMLTTRIFKLVLVTKGHGTGIEITGHPDKEITYVGDEVVVRL